MGATCVAGFIGDDRVACQLLQRDRRAVLLEQRVPRRHDDGVRPPVARQRDELVVARQRLGGDTNVGLAGEQHLRDLLG
ncbi:hypothetical protein SDC9_166571 [bioreactor metagenome]|uniref:Uncharacterized protein n=1 Tax=bioreactor metagenome TaxID=1076179 RepID=A0A645FXN2_9ZZZZ